MKKLPLLCFSFFVCFSFSSSCDEDENELPPITMEGKNTFGCLVNGKLFLSKGRPGNVGTYAEVQYGQDTVGVNIYATNHETDQRFIFSFYDSPDLLERRRYYFAQAARYTIFYVAENCDYRVDNLIDGWIELNNYDINNLIISGTFEFTMYNLDCGDTIKITNGRFDIGELTR